MLAFVLSYLLESETLVFGDSIKYTSRQTNKSVTASLSHHRYICWLIMRLVKSKAF